LVVNPPNRQALGAPPPTPLPPAAGGFALRPLFRFNDKRMYRDPTYIEHFRMLLILGIFGAKQLDFLPPSPLSKRTFPRHCI